MGRHRCRRQGCEPGQTGQLGAWSVQQALGKGRRRNQSGETRRQETDHRRRGSDHGVMGSGFVCS